MIAQKVMRDRELPAMSKAIYSYLCAFAGSIKGGGDRQAFPGVKLMMAELGIKTDDTFYKYRKPLVDRGYLKVRQERGNGKFAKNIYSIVAVPAPTDGGQKTDEPAPKQDSAPSPKKSGTDKTPHSKKSGTVNSHPAKTGTKTISSLKVSVSKNISSSLVDRTSIDDELKEKYPAAPFNEIKQQLLADDTAKIDTDKQYKSLLEYRLKSWQPKQQQPQKKRSTSRKPIRTEFIPDHMKDDYVAPAPQSQTTKADILAKLKAAGY